MAVAVIRRFYLSTICRKKFIYLSGISRRKLSGSSRDMFISNELLTVFEFHLYELLKFVLKSLKKMHSETYLNELFEYEHSTLEGLPKIT